MTGVQTCALPIYEKETDPEKKELLKFEWGMDFGAPHETEITKLHDKPVFVYGYPSAVKAFYMEPWPDRPEVCKSVDLLAPEGYRSQTITVVSNPPSFDCGEFNKFIAPRGMRLANGYGDLKGKTFRIAHMAEIQMSDLETLLAAIDEFMQGK